MSEAGTKGVQCSNWSSNQSKGNFKQDSLSNIKGAWLIHGYPLDVSLLPTCTAPAHHKITVHGLLVQCLARSNLSQQVTRDRITDSTQLKHWEAARAPAPWKYLAWPLLFVGGAWWRSVGRVFAKFFLLFSWVSNEPGSKHWLWLHNYGHPHFYDLFLTQPGAGSRSGGSGADHRK